MITFLSLSLPFKSLVGSSAGIARRGGQLVDTHGPATCTVGIAGAGVAVKGGSISVCADATVKRVVSVNDWPPTITGTGISNCGKGAVGTLTGRCGVSSSPETAIQSLFSPNCS